MFTKQLIYDLLNQNDTKNFVFRTNVLDNDGTPLVIYQSGGIGKGNYVIRTFKSKILNVTEYFISFEVTTTTICMMPPSLKRDKPTFTDTEIHNIPLSCITDLSFV